MTDPHQVISIMAIQVNLQNIERNSRSWSGTEKAKQISKCLLAALEDAGYEIVSTDKGVKEDANALG